MIEINKVYHGNCLEVLKTLPDNSIDCCITSPPYWGLRDYGTAQWDGGDVDCEHSSLLESQLKPGSTSQTPASQSNGTRTRQNTDRSICRKCGAIRIDSQLGLEKTPEEYVANMVKVFREVKRVLKKDGTLWLNLGDSYYGSWGNSGSRDGGQREVNSERFDRKAWDENINRPASSFRHESLKPKDLVGIPWRVAFALQADGWWLRQDIIWAKPNPMPESVTDRCTKSHEYIFLMSRSAQYFYDAEAIKEKQAEVSKERAKYGWNPQHPNGVGIGIEAKQYKNMNQFVPEDGMRNKRSVWTVTTKPFSESHFATFPEDLIVDMIKAGCRDGGIILDPFMGAGTTALVARKLNRNFIGIELNKEYIKIAEKRLKKELGLFH